MIFNYWVLLKKKTYTSRKSHTYTHTHARTDTHIWLMYAKTSSTEVLMIVASWFPRSKKTAPVEVYQKRHNNA